ncbi:Fe-S cluster assembly protein HesB [Methanofollis fontis]|uniref:Fe-S cluster assembly protein HesB n=2 Tax=Methanofollis fontis TaxID=2052832 RepID=A0A483CT44_9EURY|nr:Fe-S cluster assembly protein HesB [Methanofollis fontis]
MIGAILTQQTRWENVEAALSRLREAGLCSLEGIDAAPDRQIEDLIRPAGYYRIKRGRLKALCRAVLDAGGIPALQRMPDPDLRDFLLSIHGVGEETADSILCYALGRPSFVVDAYTKRICGCMGITGRYGVLKALFEEVIPTDTEARALAHAWIVEYAKEMCGKKRCNECRIVSLSGSD